METAMIYYNEQFYYDLGDVIEKVLEEESIDSLDELDDDFNIIIEHTELKPIFQITDYRLAEMFYDANDDKYPEDESCDIEIRKAINECFDLEKFNSKIPKLYYPNKETEQLWKKDLLAY